MLYSTAIILHIFAISQHLSVVVNQFHLKGFFSIHFFMIKGNQLAPHARHLEV